MSKAPSTLNSVFLVYLVFPVYLVLLRGMRKCVETRENLGD